MLRRENIQMDVNGFEDFYVPACMELLHVDGMEARGSYVIRKFDKMLGVTLVQDYVHRNAFSDEPLPDDWKQFLTALAGPYGESILKVYQIKNGLVHEPSV